MVILNKPFGYCLGVRNSVNKVLNTAPKFPHTKIVFLHPLVHNKETNKEILSTLKAEVYDSAKEPGYYKDSLFILPAHGNTRRDRLLVKGLISSYIDCTCPVLITAKNMMKKDLDAGYKVYFLGKKEHAETKAVLDFDDRIILIPQEDFMSFDYSLLDKEKKVSLYPQSTLGIEDYQAVISLFEKHVKGKFNRGNICHECMTRWTSLRKSQAKPNSTFVIVGDETSSNANEFLMIAKKSFPDSKVFLFETKEDAKKHLKEINFRFDVLIYSSTSSTSKAVVDIYKTLRRANFLEKLLHPLRGLSK
jgi:4-hydroxy-3-methylbut-2-en-1-yl diphosphate reductase